MVIFHSFLYVYQRVILAETATIAIDLRFLGTSRGYPGSPAAQQLPHTLEDLVAGDWGNGGMAKHGDLT